MGHAAFHNAAKNKILHFITFLPRIAKHFAQINDVQVPSTRMWWFSIWQRGFSIMRARCSHYYAVDFLFLYPRPGFLQGSDYTCLNGDSGDKIIYSALLHNH